MRCATLRVQRHPAEETLRFAHRTLEPTPADRAAGESGSAGARAGGDRGAQRGAEIAHRDRLPQHGTDAELGLLAGVEDEVAAEDDRRDPHALPAQQAQELAAGETRHLLVEQESVEGAPRAEEQQGLHAVDAGLDLEALFGETFDEYLA